MRNARPKNLNLFTIHFPIPAIISILHRVSGFFLFLLVPAMLWLLSYSLTLSGFENLKEWFGQPLVKIFFWLLCIPFCFHLIAGIRHLLMDVHVGEDLKTGRTTAYGVLIFSIIMIILAGIWLW